MSETITACENVCRDFGSWWPGMLSWMADLATVFGVGFAFVQIRSWKHQHKAIRASEVAIKMLGSLKLFKATFNAARMHTGPTHRLTPSDIECARELLKSLTPIQKCIYDDAALLEVLGFPIELSIQTFDCVFKARRALSRYEQAQSDNEREKARVLFVWSPGQPNEIDEEVENFMNQLTERLQAIARLESSK